MQQNIDLHELLLPWIPSAPVVALNNMVLDSRIATVNDLFIAIIGNKLDGRNYIYQAIKKGVSAILAEAQGKTYNGDIHYINNIPIIYVSHLDEHLSEIAGRFYQNPSRSMHLVGVTGTNGKTTIVNLLAQWVNLLGEKSAIMSTIGNGHLNHIVPSNNTTSSAIENQKFLAYLKNKGTNFVAMEVSSHGLTQHRVNDLYFSAAIFTNLSIEHLDYHGNMKNYESAKWKLFSSLHVKNHIINANDNIGCKWLTKLPNAVTVASYDQQIFHNGLQLINVYYHTYNTDIYFTSKWGKGIISSKLLGRFNVDNLLLALVTLLILGYPLSSLLSTSKQLYSVKGRMEKFCSVHCPTVIVDYAHTPNALKCLLITARYYCQGKLWCIFGCGGNRDFSKRPIMGAIAEQYADYVIITDDNPRHEPSQNIINDIKTGLLHPNCIKVITNRIQAIKTVIKQARINDVVILAGKGCEEYQMINNQVFNYSDRTIIKQLLKCE